MKILPTIYKTKNYEWRLCLDESQWVGRFTKYEFREIGSNVWRDYKDFPTYNFNDSFSGLPKGLSKIYKNHKAEIENFISYGLPKATSCPLCENGKANLHEKNRLFYYLCENCNEEFTTTECDELSLKNLKAQKN